MRISNWTNGQDHLIFDGAGLTGNSASGQVGQVHFINFRGTATIVDLGNGTNELKPIDASATLVRGDFNGDKSFTIADIAPMETALTDLATFQTSYPGGVLADYDLPDVADVNNDGVINNADIQTELPSPTAPPAAPAGCGPRTDNAGVEGLSCLSLTSLR